MSSETDSRRRAELWIVFAVSVLALLWYASNQILYLLAAGYQLLGLIWLALS
jgi:hypothetical protein